MPAFAELQAALTALQGAVSDQDYAQAEDALAQLNELLTAVHDRATLEAVSVPLRSLINELQALQEQRRRRLSGSAERGAQRRSYQQIAQLHSH